MPEEKIFVSIPAYRDSELLPTVNSLFENASNPQNIHVCVCWQYDPEHETSFVNEDPNRQISVINVNSKYSKGVCWARSLIERLYSDEDYCLQIDSHMRFVPDWDLKLINLIQSTGSPKAILSSYPPPYTPPNNLDYAAPPGQMAYNEIEKFSEGIPSFVCYYTDSQEDFSPSYGIAAGFSFFHGSRIKEVPYDPFLYFTGEEITMTVRSWTHGYDLYNPLENIVFHYYAPTTPDRGMHPHDHADFYTRYDQPSKKRIKHILGIEESMAPEILQEMEKYGLGNARSLEDFQAYFQVDFAKNEFSANARLGNF